MRRTSLICAVVAVLGASTSASTYVIAPDGSGDFPTIQSAIDAAVDGDIIELTDGVFAGDGNRDIEYGGKAITLRSQGGDPSFCIVDCGGSQGDPHRGFLFESGEGPDARLEGVTIRNGYAAGHGFEGSGAGVYCSMSSPTIANCIFGDNTAEDYGGGGLFCWMASPVLTDCSFLSNLAENGAGVLCVDRSSVELIACSFSSNTAAWKGGGLKCIQFCAPVLGGCTFSGNVAAKGGGVWSDWSSPTLTCCALLGNSAGEGAGVGCEGNSFQPDATSPTIVGCVFSGNHAADNGGGVFCDECSPTLADCTLSHNSAPRGSGLACWATSATSLSNTISVFSTDGEAVHCDGTSSATLTCCDVYGNAGGDWVGCIQNQLGEAGNISSDPEFCSPTPHEDQNWTLQSDSPCTSEQSGCGRIGAQDVGCDNTPTKRTTWGRIKAIYRVAE